MGAFGFGGLGAPCCCGGGTTTLCIRVCPGHVPVYGAVITVAGFDPCTTDATGCCAVDGITSGTYAVTVTVNGATVYSDSRPVTAGAMNIITIDAPSNIVCCGGLYIPYNLTLTDGLGSISLVYCPSCSGTIPTWTGGHSATLSSRTVTTPFPGACVVAAASSGPVRVCYQMLCRAGQTFKFSIQRSWGWVNDPQFNAFWYQDPSGFAPGSPCVVAPPPACGTPHTDTASDAQNPTSTAPFAISFSPVAFGGNATSDPIGGGVTVSQ